MNLLLDTHAFLWFVSGDARLGPGPRALIEDSSNTRLLSVASLWEIAIKSSLGRLQIGVSFQEFADQHVIGNNIGTLGIDARDLDVLTNLPFHHRDPFDRLIIAQARARSLYVLSQDAAFSSYELTVLWDGADSDG